MYEYINGRLEEQGLDYVILDLNQMGYKIKVSKTTLNELPSLESTVKLFLHQIIKEDEVSLYGFISREEREIFRTIIGISGIGPKAGIGLLSQFSRGELIMYILQEDPKSIAKAPGIGIKTASRIILELKDRYKDEPQTVRLGVKIVDDSATEAINGLTGLGYSLSEASELVQRVFTPQSSLEELIKAALSSASMKGR